MSGAIQTPSFEPPYPADTLARGWRLEIDHERIERSDTWALAATEVRPWLLMMWMIAWRQAPCGTLPDDDALIAARIGMPPKLFAKHRAVLMRGWWQAADGRLYHNTIVECVLAMLVKREKDAKRSAERRARQAKPHEGRIEVADASRVTHEGRTDDSGVSSPGVRHQAPSTRSKPIPSITLGSSTTVEKVANDLPPPAAQADQNATTRPPQDPITARAIELTILLRQRGAGLQASDPRVRQWAEIGISDAQALTALETAQQRRSEKGSAQAINAGLLDALLADQRRSPPARASPNRPPSRDELRRAAAMTRLSDVMNDDGTPKRPKDRDDERTLTATAPRLVG